MTRTKLDCPILATFTAFCGNIDEDSNPFKDHDASHKIRTGEAPSFSSSFCTFFCAQVKSKKNQREMESDQSFFPPFPPQKLNDHQRPESYFSLGDSYFPSSNDGKTPAREREKRDHYRRRLFLSPPSSSLINYFSPAVCGKAG